MKKVRQIFKYQLEVGQTVHKIPAGYFMLDVQVQNGIPCAWCIVDPNAADEIEVTFTVVGTGHPFDKNGVGQYLGTFQQQGGALIWHVFYTPFS